MPDFADRRDKKRRIAKKKAPVNREERPLHEGGRAPSKVAGKESPISRFGRLIRDFSGGITVLRDVAGALSKLGEGARAGNVFSHGAERAGSGGKSPPSAKTLPSTRAPSPVTPLAGYAKTKPTIIDDLGARKVSHLSRKDTSARTRQLGERTIRIPPSHSEIVRKSQPGPGVGGLGRHPGRTGADLEAQRHIYASRLDPSRPADMSSAARLAQILQADRLMATGELEPHPQVQAWATSIREGRRREVADLDPEAVHSTLIGAVGGATAAERLLATPEVQKLTERHRSHLQRHRSELLTLEDRLERTIRDRGAHGAARGALKPGSGMEKPATAIPARAAFPFPQRAAREPLGGDRHDYESMQHMLATNEEPHLASVAGMEQERLQREIRDVSSDRRMSVPAASSPARQSVIAPPAERSPAAQITAAPASARAAAAMPAPHQQDTPGGGNKRIRGEMKLISTSGQEIGVAQMDAEM